MFINRLKEIIEEAVQNDVSRGTIVDRCIDQVCKEFGGDKLYIPLRPIDKKLRNQAIKEEFDGTNLYKICRKYNLSRSSVYGILNGRQ